MNNSPADWLEECSAQWLKCSQSLYISEQNKQEIEGLLNDITDNICDIQFHNVKNESDDACVSRAFDAWTVIKHSEELKNKLFELKPIAENSVDNMENLNILISQVNSIIYATKKLCSLDLPKEPAHRLRMNINNCPPHPVYSEGVLNNIELEKLYKIREVIGIVCQADKALQNMKPDSDLHKYVISNVPAVVRILHSIPKTIDELDSLLQRKYSDAYNAGIGILSESLGCDAAEKAMYNEAEIIQNYHSNRKQSRTL